MIRQLCVVKESYDKETETVPTNFNEKYLTFRTENLCILFLLITIALLTAVSIYCYLIKY